MLFKSKKQSNLFPLHFQRNSSDFRLVLIKFLLFSGSNLLQRRDFFRDFPIFSPLFFSSKTIKLSTNFANDRIFGQFPGGIGKRAQSNLGRRWVRKKNSPRPVPPTVSCPFGLKPTKPGKTRPILENGENIFTSRLSLVAADGLEKSWA